MSVESLMTKPVTLITRAATGAEDEWGSPVMGETRHATHCHVSQQYTTDQDLGSVTVVAETMVLYLPARTGLGPYDAVELDNESYEVVGEPKEAWNARLGQVNHIRVTVRKARP